jgi:hypothetical protein
MLRLLILFGFILFVSTQNSFAQLDSVFNNFSLIKTDFDTTYIQLNTQRWGVNLFLGNKGYSFSQNINTGDHVSFTPAASNTFGGGISYKNIGFSYGFNLNTIKTDSGKLSKGISFLSSFYAGQHVLDVGFQTTKGYFVTKYNANQELEQSYYRNDIANINLFVNYLYNFNYKRFSLNASYNGSQTQIKSAGSPLAGAFFSYFDVHANTPLIPPSFVDSVDAGKQFSEGTIFTSGIIGGYAYTFVLPLKFNFGEVKSDKYYQIADPVTVSYKIISRESLGRDFGKQFYTRLAFFSDRVYMTIKDSESKKVINNHANTFKFLVGFRFD